MTEIQKYLAEEVAEESVDDSGEGEDAAEVAEPAEGEPEADAVAEEAE